jgi:hypothetical protein
MSCCSDESTSPTGRPRIGSGDEERRDADHYACRSVKPLIGIVHGWLNREKGTLAPLRRGFFMEAEQSAPR